MARNHMRWQVGALSTDDDIRALTPYEKLAYWFVNQDTYLNPAGAITMCPESWAEDLGISTSEMTAALNGLAKKRFVVMDKRTHELLVRTFIHWDGIADQPNMLKQTLAAARRIKSPELRRVLAAELRRLPPAPPPKELSKGRVMVYPDPHACADDIETPGTPPPNPSGKTTPKPSENPSGKGVQTAFLEPQGVGEGEGEVVTSRSTSVRSSSRKKPETPIPDTWRPNDNHRRQASDLSLDVNSEAGKFRNHAHSHDRRLANWDAGFRNWLVKAGEYRPQLRSVSGWGSTRQDPGSGVFVER